MQQSISASLNVQNTLSKNVHSEKAKALPSLMSQLSGSRSVSLKGLPPPILYTKRNISWIIEGRGTEMERVHEGMRKGLVVWARDSCKLGGRGGEKGQHGSTLQREESARKYMRCWRRQRLEETGGKKDRGKMECVVLPWLLTSWCKEERARSAGTLTSCRNTCVPQKSMPHWSGREEG